MNNINNEINDFDKSKRCIFHKYFLAQAYIIFLYYEVKFSV